MPIICDTATVPVAERREFWEHAASELFVPMEIFSPPEAPIKGRLLAAGLGPLTLATVDASAQTVRRSRRLVASTRGDYYSFSLMLWGTATVVQDRREAIW